MNGTETGTKYCDTDDTLWDTLTGPMGEHVDVMEIWGWPERTGFSQLRQGRRYGPWRRRGP
jgi:hypothetical protein